MSILLAFSSALFVGACLLIVEGCAARSPIVTSVTFGLPPVGWKPTHRLRHCTPTGALVHLADGRTLVELRCPDSWGGTPRIVAADDAGKQVR